jgi:hypothetical protein
MVEHYDKVEIPEDVMEKSYHVNPKLPILELGWGTLLLTAQPNPNTVLGFSASQ